MRGLILAVLMVATPVLADETAPPLAAGEIWLKVGASGVARSPADSVTVKVSINATGPTAAAARAAANDKLAAARKSLVAAGIPDAAITAGGASTNPFAAMLARGEEADAEAPGPAAPGAMAPAKPAPRRHAQSSLVIRLADPAAMSRLEQALDSGDLVVDGRPDFALRDDRSARRAAIADGLSRARADAAAQAEALGLRVARIVKVAEQATDISLAISRFDKGMPWLPGNDALASREIVTTIPVVVDFVLAPR